MKYDEQKFEDLNEGSFQIIANWTSAALKEVNNNLITVIKNGIGKKRFKHDDKIIINILDDVKLDASLAISLSQLLAGKFSKYEVEYVVSTAHKQVLSKSEAFKNIRLANKQLIYYFSK